MREVWSIVVRILYLAPGVRIVLLAVVALVALVAPVASDMDQQSPGQRPVAFAQDRCFDPTITSYFGVHEGIEFTIGYIRERHLLSFTEQDPETSEFVTTTEWVMVVPPTTDPEYEFQLKLATQAWSDVSWEAVPDSGKKANLYKEDEGWTVLHWISDLEPLTTYDYHVRAKCNGEYGSATIPREVTTAKTKTYILTIEDADGMEIDSITEGESAKLKLTLEDSEVPYPYPALITVSLFHAGYCCREEPDLPWVTEGEVLISSVDDHTSPSKFKVSRDLNVGSREIVFTLNVPADRIVHSAAPDDNEAEFEVVGFDFQISKISGAILLSTTSGLEDGLLKIIDGPATDPPPPPPTLNRPATGTVTIYRNRQLLTSDLADVKDADGLPPGGFVYTYQWHRGTSPDLIPIPGAESAEYTITTDDIGSPLTLEVYFEDFNGTVETLSGSRPPITWGPDITWPFGPERGPYAEQTLVANTDLMFYEDLPLDRAFAFQWIYVDANGNFEDEILGETLGRYELSSVDVGKYIQVGVAYVSTVELEDGEPKSITRFANKQTPEVQEAINLSSPEGLTANVASGVLTVSWTFVPGIGIREPTDFQYRYSPFNPADYTAQRSSEGWQTVRGGAIARSFVLRENLINAAVYTIQVRSIDERFLADAASDTDLTTTVETTATYRHRTDPC